MAEDELKELLAEIEDDPTPIHHFIMPDGTIKHVQDMTDEEKALLFNEDEDDGDESDEGEGGE